MFSSVIKLTPFVWAMKNLFWWLKGACFEYLFASLAEVGESSKVTRFMFLPALSEEEVLTAWATEAGFNSQPFKALCETDF